MANFDWLRNINATAEGISPFAAQLIMGKKERKRKLEDLKKAQAQEDKERRLKFLMQNVDDPAVRPHALEAFGIQEEQPMSAGSFQQNLLNDPVNQIAMDPNERAMAGEVVDEQRRAQSARRLQELLDLSGANVVKAAGEGVMDVPGMSRKPTDIASESLYGAREGTQKKQQELIDERKLTEQERRRTQAAKTRDVGLGRKKSAGKGFNVRQKLSDLENYQRDVKSEMTNTLEKMGAAAVTIQRALADPSYAKLLRPEEKPIYAALKEFDRQRQDLVKLEHVLRGFKKPDSVEEIAEWLEKGYLTEAEALELDRKFPNIPERLSKKKGK